LHATLTRMRAESLLRSIGTRHRGRSRRASLSVLRGGVRDQVLFLDSFHPHRRDRIGQRFHLLPRRWRIRRWIRSVPWKTALGRRLGSPVVRLREGFLPSLVRAFPMRMKSTQEDRPNLLLRTCTPLPGGVLSGFALLGE